MPDSTSQPQSSPDRPSGGPPSAGHLATARLTIGERVVVRHRLTGEAATASGAGATDHIGELLARSNDEIVLATALGAVRLRREDVIAAKDVPPPAARRGPAHTRVDAGELQKVMAKGWRGTEQAQLGEWVLRSAPGYTGRANSVLPVGDPTLEPDAAVAWCERWYEERGARAMFQVFGDEGFDPADDELGSLLLQRGYTAGGNALVMTALSAQVPELTQDSVPVVADAQLTPAWLIAYGEGGRVVPGVTEAVLTGSDGQLFLRVEQPEAPGRESVAGVARLAIHPGWAGVFALRVADSARRRGIGTAVVSAAAMVARENNMPAMYIQVASDNTEGVAFWRHLGFTVHHEYLYLTAPEPATPAS